MTEIPRAFEGFDRYRKNGMTHKLRELEIGEFAEFPLAKRTSLHTAAQYAGIKIVTRQMGSKDTCRAYRTE